MPTKKNAYKTSKLSDIKLCCLLLKAHFIPQINPRFKPLISNIFNNFHRDIPEDVLNTYCWIHSTYTVVDAFMKKQGFEVPFPGIDNSQGSRGPLTIKHTKYYQWVAFTLFFQVS